METAALIGFDKWADEKQGKVFKSFVAGDPDALDAYKKAYQDGQIKVGDLIFNGKTYTFVTKGKRGGLLMGLSPQQTQRFRAEAQCAPPQISSET